MFRFEQIVIEVFSVEMSHSLCNIYKGDFILIQLLSSGSRCAECHMFFHFFHRNGAMLKYFIFHLLVITAYFASE